MLYATEHCLSPGAHAELSEYIDKVTGYSVFSYVEF